MTRPNWGRYHVFSTSYPPVEPAGVFDDKGTINARWPKVLISRKDSHVSINMAVIPHLKT